MQMLSFYISEKRHHADMPLYEWLLQEARSIGAHGGSVFRAVAAFGRNGRMHEEIFFELAGEMSVNVEFILEAQQAEQLLELLRKLSLDVFYVRQEVESGVV